MSLADKFLEAGTFRDVYHRIKDAKTFGELPNGLFLKVGVTLEAFCEAPYQGVPQDYHNMVINVTPTAGAPWKDDTVLQE